MNPQPITPTSLRNAAITTAQDILADPDRYVILDTETSGIGKQAEILELAILSPSKETLFHQYFKPQLAISPQAAAIHGLSLEVLEQNGAIAWREAHETINNLLDGKTILAYNVQFDLAILQSTCSLNGLTLTANLDSLCLMRLYQTFTSNKQPQPLGGDHTAIGDCLAAIALLEEMAQADLLPDPAALPPQTVEDIAQLNQQINELTAQIKPLEQQLAVLKQQVLDYLVANQLSELPIGQGKKLKLYHSARDVKPIGSLDQLPDRLKKVVLDRRAAQVETKDWTVASPYVTYTPSASFRQVNL